MLRDVTVRGFSSRTHEAYIRQVVGLARHYRRSPDQLSADEVQSYLAHLYQARKRSWSTCAQAAHAFRFLYHVTLGRETTAFHVPAVRQPQTLPDILSREEVWRLLRACTHPWHRLLLATTYAARLRVSEVVALKVADLDADRMTRHVCQGKGAKDRYVPLSARLLQDWRAYWRIRPPHVWLFANRQGTRPIDITVAQKLYTMTDCVSVSSLLIPGWVHLVTFIDTAREALTLVAHAYLTVGYNLAADASLPEYSLRELLRRAGFGAEPESDPRGRAKPRESQ